MRPIRACAAIFVLFAGLLGPTACARECVPVVREGWIRMPPMAMPMLAGFGQFRNPCAEPIVIVAASSPAFGEVSLHETRIVDGISRMRPIDRLKVAPNDGATLQPGGLHLMLMQPRAALVEGSSVSIEFALEGGGVLRGEFMVRKAGG